jgi:histidinol-phosphatase (PHP family)
MAEVLDYHVHLWPHSERAEPLGHRLERLADYVEVAARNGIAEIALTEHLFRFVQLSEVAGEFWRSDPDAGMRAETAGYIDFHATADLDAYVEDILEAKAAGLPVVLGLEVDYLPGRMEAISRVLAGYPFDVLLGSVHWLSAWGFDNLDSEPSASEWERRPIETVWRAYAEAIDELAGTGAVDVLAHPDLVKLTGHRPPAAVVEECEERIAEAARRSGMAAEISSAGLRKPVGEAYPSPSLLAKFFARAVPVTTASDSHGPALVGTSAATLAGLARGAGYGSLRGFVARRGRDVPIGERGSAGATR